MSLSEIKNKFRKGEIDKWKYIDEMYSVHSNLFDYSSFIRNTNISEICITDSEVAFTFRDSLLKFICSLGDKRLAPFETINFESYEMDEFNMQMNLIDDGYTIFDIGANFGWYSMYSAKYKPKSAVYAFEPVPNSFSFLKKNIERNNLKNVQAFNFGFSDEAGSFDLYYDPQLSVNASLANLTGADDMKKVSCRIERIDDFTVENKLIIDFIKCDVEGAELLVFKGGQKTIRNNPPVIFTEMLRKWTAKFSYSPNDIIDFLSELGYRCFVLGSDNKLERLERVDESTVETNYYFLHLEKHADKIKKYVNHG